MYWLKACRKCQGDLYKNEDSYGSILSCLQCSHYLTEGEEAALMGRSENDVSLSKSYAILGDMAA